MPSNRGFITDGLRRVIGDTMGKEYWIGDVTAGSHDAKEVVLKGWVHRARGSNKIWFIVVRDSTGHIQCVAKREAVGDECFESLRNALIESSVEITGVVEPTDREHGHEVQVSSATVVLSLIHI